MVDSTIESRASLEYISHRRRSCVRETRNILVPSNIQRGKNSIISIALARPRVEYLAAKIAVTAVRFWHVLRCTGNKPPLC